MNTFDPSQNKFLLNQRQISQISNLSKSKVARNFSSKPFHKVMNAKYYEFEVISEFLKSNTLEYHKQLTSSIQFLSGKRKNPLKDQLILQIGYLMPLFYEKVNFFDLHSYRFLSENLEKVSNKTSKSERLTSLTYDLIELKDKISNYFSKNRILENQSDLAKILVEYLVEPMSQVEDSIKDLLDSHIDELMLSNRISLQSHCHHYSKSVDNYFKPKDVFNTLAIFSLEDRPIISKASFNFIVVDDTSIHESEFILKNEKIDGIIDCTKNGLFECKASNIEYIHVYLENLIEESDHVSMNTLFFEEKSCRSSSFKKISKLTYWLVKLLERKNKDVIKYMLELDPS